MHLACMLHIVYLYRCKNLSATEKVKSFLQWNFSNLLISQYTNTYVAMLFSNQEFIRAPKGANNDEFENVLNGCINQAWDLSNLSSWSTLYMKEENAKEVYLFATADTMLKRIFINTHSGADFLDLIYSIFPKREAQQVIDYYEENANSENRIRPDFGENPTQYLHDLVQKEKERLAKYISDN